MPGTWSKLLDIEECCAKYCLTWLHPCGLQMSGHKDSCFVSPFPPSPQCFLCLFWDSRHVGHYTRTGTRWEGNLCTNNQYPHVVSVYTVYASVTLKVMEESLHQVIPSIPLRIQMTLRMVTDADMETWQHNLWEQLFPDVYTDTYERRHSLTEFQSYMCSISFNRSLLLA